MVDDNSTERREPMTAVDAAWLRMEEPVNSMTITGILAFEGPLDWQTLRGVVRDRLANHDRFRARPSGQGKVGRPAWIHQDSIDLDHHLVRVSLPEPAGKQELQDFVSREMATSLDFSRPLWRFYYVDNFRYGSAIVARVHHAIGDGMSLVRVLMGLADDGVDVAALTPQAVGKANTKTVTETRASASPLAAVTSVAGTLVRLLARRRDPATRIKGALAVEKRCAWSDPLPLDRVKAIGKKLDGTVNDVLVSAVAGALRIYLEEKGDAVDRRGLRAVIPVNLRPLDDLDRLGNRFGLVFLPLPVGEADPLVRFDIVRRRMNRIKRSPEAFVTFALLKLIGHTGPGFVGWAINLFGTKATTVLTNVPGPRDTLHLAGRPVDGFMFWVPQSGRLGLGVSLLSYRGGVRVGVASDAKLLPDPEAVVDAYARALDQLASAAGV
jgi:diacylglycerol O-acyltransferase